MNGLGAGEASGSILDRFTLLIERRLGRFVSPTFLLFSLVGASGVFVHMAAFGVGEWAGLPHVNTGIGSWFDPLYVSVPTAYMIATAWNYVLNNVVTFRKIRHRGAANVRPFVLYNVISLLSMLIHTGVFQLLQTNGVMAGILTEDIRKFANNGAGIVAAFATKYYLNVAFTWRKET